MRYDKDHKAQTRSVVLDNASMRFRQEGIQAVGIASLMADAGLTHGGFYAHFTSKEKLVEAAIGKAFDTSVESLRKVAEEPGEQAPMEALIDAYLSARHRDYPGYGCAAAALGAEVARLAPETRQAYGLHLDRLIVLIAQQLDQKKDETLRKQTATAIFSTMVGALQMSRTVESAAQSLAFIEAGKSAALALARSFGLR
ncbi:MAG: TetR/AcrR family transcriptional regulator [Noviherbaspirillum sp.]